MHHMRYVVIHEIWLLPWVMCKFVDSLHVFILILCHLVVEPEGEVGVFLFFIGVFVITKFLVVPVSNIQLCEDSGY